MILQEGGQNGRAALLRSQETAGAPLAVQVEDSLDFDAALALWRQAETACVFNHPAWWRAALDSFGQGRRVVVLTLRADGDIVACWPFWEKRLGARDAFARILEPVGSRSSDYVMPLIRRGHAAPPLITAMLRALAKELSPRSLLLWPKADDIPVSDAAARDLRERGFLVHRQLRLCPRMVLAPSYGALEARWSRNHRSQVRRRIRRLKEKGNVDLFLARTRAEIQTRLPVLFAMHRANWGVRSAASEFENAQNVRFIERLAGGLPPELLHYSEVRVDGAPVSCAFNFIRERAILGYKSAFDLAFRQCSPGMAHVALLSRWGIENGFETLDFMQGEESYKYLWADSVGETVSHAVASPSGLPVWLWNTKARKLIVEFKL